MSFNHIRSRFPRAAEVLQSLCFLAEESLPPVLFPGDHKSDEMRGAIDVLIRYEFVSERPREGSLDMHRWVRLAMRSWIRQQGLWKGWMKSETKHMGDIANVERPILEYRGWGIIFPHTATAVEFADDCAYQPVAMDLRFKTAFTYLQRGNYDECRSLLSFILRECESLYGIRGTLTRAVRLELARTLELQRDFRPAVLLLRKNLCGTQDASDHTRQSSDHTGQSSRDLLADIYCATDNRAELERMEIGRQRRSQRRVERKARLAEREQKEQGGERREQRLIEQLVGPVGSTKEAFQDSKQLSFRH